MRENCLPDKNLDMVVVVVAVIVTVLWDFLLLLLLFPGLQIQNEH
jgi:hypothetical protein